MDVEIENVIKIIFPDDNWKENPDVALYITKLGSFGVEQLSKEPDRLNEEKSSVLEQTQQLAFANYKTFIQTAECSREIFKQFNNTEQNLESLLKKLPEFSQRCQDFSKASSDINTHRRLNSLTLTRNAQLLEILELPQLMDTCIRNGNYEEALELAAYVRRLGKKHGQIQIIASIVKDVETAWLSMLHQLLAQLRTDLQLPRCLQVVGYLRRMELFSEAELRLKFLQARDTWLQNLLSAIPKEDANHHLSKTIELSRIHLFSIVTQYRAIFSDDEPILPLPKDQNINETAIFYSWITEKVSQFLTTLEQDLNRGVGNSLDSVIGQCMYFGLSFSRVGADFRGLIAPIFIGTISQNFEHAVRKASKKFDQEMENFTLSKLPQPSLSRNVPPSQSSKQEHPPQCLLEFHPLADYCNGILTAFNELRLCAPVAVADNVTNQLRESLSGVARSTLGFYRQEQQALTQAEKDNFTKFCAYFAEELLPYVQKCLHAVFPPAVIASHLGVGIQHLQKEGLTYFDQAAILDPINHLLPVKVEPPSISSSHRITLFKQDSIPPDSTAVKPNVDEPAQNVELDTTPTSSSVCFSNTEDINQFQESSGNSVLQPEEPKPDHF
ncbi:conserved oligomeric Golgi complex subunit 8 isoform X2 [Zootermopsis nevadensis]|uniref:conserved oligomeric Golgi complex subunit 8 isoform X2 n=1 Tax=Zootermopsis nevadensis TaxID=136037 RepID=UPI000B8EC281|nr:conserved oligomeric Golgi complex subunit 8 isoform X2 [Zootermopsis nevadensis]